MVIILLKIHTDPHCHRLKMYSAIAQSVYPAADNMTYQHQSFVPDFQPAEHCDMHYNNTFETYTWSEYMVYDQVNMNHNFTYQPPVMGYHQSIAVNNEDSMVSMHVVKTGAQRQKEASQRPQSASP